MAEDSVSTIRQLSLDLRDAMPPERIQAFLAQACGTADVVICDVELPTATGVSSGAVFFTARIGDAEPVRLFLKFDTGAPVRPFHQYDLGQQFAVQSVLFDAGLPTPEPLYLDATGEHLGKPGQIMKVISAEAGSSKAWLEGALATASPSERDAMLLDAIAQMARMHAVDVSDPRLASLRERAGGANSVEREINWTLDLARHHEFTDPRIDAAAAALRDAAPADVRDVFNHGDNKFDNYLFANGKVAALIDFEMSAIAPRELDLAYLLFTTENLTPPDSPRPDWFPDEAALVRLYEQASGVSLTDWDYYRALIAFKFSVMVLAFTSRLGLLAQAPQMFAAYWAAIENIPTSLERK